MKGKKKERKKRIWINVPVDVPESEYKKFERFSELSGLPLETICKMSKICPKCLEAWEPLIKEREIEKGYR